MTKVLRSRKGISPILATLLLIVIAVAAVIVTYAWVMTFTMTQTEQATILTKVNHNFYTVDGTKNRTDFELMNTGTSPAKIVAVYWSKSSSATTRQLNADEYTLNPATGVVNPESIIIITIKWGVSGGIIIDPEWVSGETYYFKFVTAAGQSYEYAEKAP